ncbi:MAG: protein translocase subunit SecD [Sporichthyaceae bacterium]
MSALKSATRGPRRALAVTGVLLIGGTAAMIGADARTPRLAIDLAGGTSVTLTAKATEGDGKVTGAAMSQAVKIIRQRVNGFGVSEAQVTTLGSDNIVVSVPGQNSAEIVAQVGQTALLRFRPVLLAGDPGLSEVPSDSDVAQDGGDGDTKKGGKKSDADADAEPKEGPAPVSSVAPSPRSTDRSRVSAGALRSGELRSGELGSGALRSVDSPTSSPTPTPARSSGPSAAPSPTSTAPLEGPGLDPATTEALEKAVGAAIPEGVRFAYAVTDCANPASRQGADTAKPEEIVVACDREGAFKYILGPSKVQGTQIDSADAGLLPGGIATWVINLDLDNEGQRAFAELTQSALALPPPTNQVAIVLDGVVYSAPSVTEAITDGNAIISGAFDKDSSEDLANVLKFGALPLAFEKSTVSTISATLGEDQLQGGLIAGIIGMVLVVAYGIFYYRALGAIAMAGLAVAAGMAWISVCLLGTDGALGYRLSLAGIAGLIVAIGITADSFVVYFERIRDEIRDGRSPRAAADAGWLRARRTIITANFVSFLAAAVLYFFSVAEVKGFAFTLGLMTLIDIAVIFLFTRPLVALATRKAFFAKGHPWSGLAPANLGLRCAAPASAKGA